MGVQDAKFNEAFTALKEAVKYKRESWQTWSNYAEAALQTNNLQAAFTGLKQVRFVALALAAKFGM